MKDPIQLIVGLGNPGTQYVNTRHNAGAEFVEQLAARQLVSLQPDKKFSGLYGKFLHQGNTIHLLIPTTFMNLSGQSVSALANFYKIPPEQILVAHDELDLPLALHVLSKAAVMAATTACAISSANWATTKISTVFV